MLRYLFAALFCVCLISGCESDPNIMNDDTPETLFIWGYSDLDNNNHRVRVRRAILEEGNMEELAQNPELVLPKDPIEVSIVLVKEKNPEITIPMSPIVYPKDDGIFASEQNIIYELNYPVPNGYAVAVSVTNLVTGDITRSEAITTTIYPFTYPQIHGWYDQQFSFTTIDEPFLVRFDIIGTSVYKLVTEIKYIDILTNGDTLFQKAIFEGQPIFEDNVWKSTPYSKTFELIYLLNIFNRTIPDIPDLKFRMFYRFNFKAWSGSKVLKDYLQYGERFEDNRKFMFSNINGGYGLFYACKNANTGNIKPAPSFAELLFSDPEVKDLKFARYIFNGNYHEPDSTNTISY